MQYTPFSLQPYKSAEEKYTKLAVDQVLVVEDYNPVASSPLDKGIPTSDANDCKTDYRSARPARSEGS